MQALEVELSVSAADVRQGCRVGSGLCTRLRRHRGLRLFPILHYHWKPALTVFSRPAEALDLDDKLQKRMPLGDSRSHLGSDMRRRWRNSEQAVRRSIPIRLRLITSMPVPASRGQARAGSRAFRACGRNQAGRYHLVPVNSVYRSLGRDRIKREPHEEASKSRT